MDPGWVTAALALATALVGLAVWALRRGWLITVRVTRFMDDWNGEPKSPGHPARPGVMERLEGVESATRRILHEVTLNSGMSVKDVVTRTEVAVTDLKAHVESVARQVENLPGGRS